jgi:hypothetical protein
MPLQFHAELKVGCGGMVWSLFILEMNPQYFALNNGPIAELDLSFRMEFQTNLPQCRSRPI